MELYGFHAGRQYNGRQSRTTVKSALRNGSNAIRELHFSQRFAGAEGVLPKRLNGGGKGQFLQTCVGKGVALDLCDITFKGNCGQLADAAEGFRINNRDTSRDDKGCQSGIFERIAAQTCQLRKFRDLR
nr:hypothetical protein [uncultured Flavonifractor sp.]